jgi:hypothetical protein
MKRAGAIEKATRACRHARRPRADERRRGPLQGRPADERRRGPCKDIRPVSRARSAAPAPLRCTAADLANALAAPRASASVFVARQERVSRLRQTAAAHSDALAALPDPKLSARYVTQRIKGKQNILDLAFGPLLESARPCLMRVRGRPRTRCRTRLSRSVAGASSQEGPRFDGVPIQTRSLVGPCCFPSRNGIATQLRA